MRVESVSLIVHGLESALDQIFRGWSLLGFFTTEYIFMGMRFIQETFFGKML